MDCPDCGAPAPVGHAFCGTCGAQVAASRPADRRRAERPGSTASPSVRPFLTVVASLALGALVLTIVVPRLRGQELGRVAGVDIDAPSPLPEVTATPPTLRNRGRIIPTTAWEADTGAAIPTAINGDAEGIYVQAASGQMLAFDAVTGAEHWQVRVPGLGFGRPVPFGAVVLIETRNGGLLALDRGDGTTAWSLPGIAPDLIGPAIVGDRIARLVAVDGGGIGIDVLDADRSPVARHEFEGMATTMTGDAGGLTVCRLRAPPLVLSATPDAGFAVAPGAGVPGACALGTLDPWAALHLEGRDVTLTRRGSFRVTRPGAVASVDVDLDGTVVGGVAIDDRTVVIAMRDGRLFALRVPTAAAWPA